MELFIIEKFPNYSISRCGKVFSLKRNVFLKHQSHNSGYPAVTLSGKHNLLHRLVAIQFIPNEFNKPCINHKDSNRNNFSIENLEWCTQSENMQHASEKGRKVQKWTTRVAVKDRKMDFFHATTIRLLYDRGYTFHDVRKLFPMSSCMFYKIINKEAWNK